MRTSGSTCTPSAGRHVSARTGCASTRVMTSVSHKRAADAEVLLLRRGAGRFVRGTPCDGRLDPAFGPRRAMDAAARGY
jgi:hypothetical protein